MNTARIYQPDKTAMQSGNAKDRWILEFEPEKPLFVNDLIGWVGMTDMSREIRLHFSTCEAAIAYAKRNNLPYELHKPHPRQQVRKAYADNFAFHRKIG